jgi:hypothetical protein
MFLPKFTQQTYTSDKDASDALSGLRGCTHKEKTMKERSVYKTRLEVKRSSGLRRVTDREGNIKTRRRPVKTYTVQDVLAITTHV